MNSTKVQRALENPDIDGKITEIVPGVFIGSLKAAVDLPQLEAHGITHILCAVNEVGQIFPKVSLTLALVNVARSLNTSR